MQIIEVGSDLSYQVESPSSFLFQVSAAQSESQRVIHESFFTVPQVPIEACKVGMLGNRMHRIEVLPCMLNVHYRASVEIDDAVDEGSSADEIAHAQLPADVLVFLNPSRYCESDRLLQLAWAEFGSIEPGYGRVCAISNWVYEQLSYVPGSTGPGTTACDVLIQRTGVCRDFAHLGISLCRALGIPARYVAGYAPGLQPPDFHGFFEAYLGHDWYKFDPTKLAPVSGFVRIGAATDAAGVSFATRIGNAFEGPMQVWANHCSTN